MAWDGETNLVRLVEEIEMLADVVSANARWAKSARDEIASVAALIAGSVDPAVVDRLSGLVDAYEGMVETPLWAQKNPYPSYEPAWES